MVKTKILINGPLPPPLGGMETYCQDYLKTDIPKQYDITFCRCILIAAMPAAKGAWGLFLRCLNRLLTLAVWLVMLIVKRPAIAHVHTNSGSGFWARGWMTLWAEKLGAKAVLHMHGAEFKEFYNSLTPAKKQRAKYYLNANSALIVLSEQWRVFFESIGIAPQKIVVMTNSVFLPRCTEPKAENEKLTVLFLSRFEKRKGIYELMEAVRRFPELTKKYRFVMAGPQSHEFNKIKELVTLDKNAAVELPGPLVGRAKAAAYQNADIYLLQSFAEGMPIGLLEAMSYGLACITTPVGGIPDVVQDRVNGLLIPPGDSKALADILQILAEDDQFRKTVGQNARMTIEKNYNWDTRAKDLSALYNRLVKS